MVTGKLQLLKETFESKFNIDKFKRFTREFFNEAEMLSGIRHIGIWTEYEKNIISYSDIAKFSDADSNKIIVFAVELKSENGVERGRSLQRNFISKILDQQNCEAAIVAFYSKNDVNWRLSFVRLDYTFKDKGLELDLTPAKRYSYLVGENETSHTAQKQLYPIFEDDKHNPTLDEIEAAFSVEKVTKDFFEQYKSKYHDLKEYLEKDEAFIKETTKLGFSVEKFSEQLAKKLMGQLAFLYFIQKKGWLGVRIMPEDHSIEKIEFMKIYNQQSDENKQTLKKLFIQGKDEKMKLSMKFYSITDTEADSLSDCFVGNELVMPWGSGDKKFIRGIFDFCINNSNKNFFDDYLEPFFYEALNKRRKNQYYKKFNCKIPFLNGGLFEPLEGYHWKEAKFEIPNKIFSNAKEKGREADGILDIFDRYNFTMNEDEPLEKEVAVDPEMLGKIFENLLDVKDRKSKGAFYTPREIVHYMCQESIINYLVKEVNVPYEDMKQFILYGELIRDADNRNGIANSKNFDNKKAIKQTIFDKIVDIDEALKKIRVADPAVGSGAYPLGMLNEIVKARNNITEYIIRKDNEGMFGKRYGKEFIKKRRSQYKMKWDTIKNSIFAVDIEPSAVDIAKLRLWLSVVVEQEIDEDNLEPHPLPNLDCNIMVGNSLIDEYEGIKLFDESLLHKDKNSNSESKSVIYSEIAIGMQLSFLIDNSDDMLKEMFELQDRYFDEDDEHKKKDIKGKIDKIRDDLIEYKLTRDGNREGLDKYNAMKKLKTKPYFIWKLEFAKVFKENGGFDIVIGNPPYIGQKKNNESFKEVKNTTFGGKYHQRRMDFFYFFFHKGLDILNKKGVLAFITTNYFFTATYADKLRLDIKTRSIILDIINFNELKIFESAMGQHNAITILRKGFDENHKANLTSVLELGFGTDRTLENIFMRKLKNAVYSKNANLEIYDGELNYIRIKLNQFSNENILNKMVTDNKSLKEYFEIIEGIHTGADSLSNSHIDKCSLDLEKGKGIFVLSRDEIEELQLNLEEQKMIKTWYKNSDINRWHVVRNIERYLIYYNSKKEYSNVTSIQKHLEQFKIILVNRKVRSGTGFISIQDYDDFVAGKKYISYVMNANAFKKGNYYAISYPREEYVFNGEKIVCPQRSTKNTFAFHSGEFFASADVYFIKNKSKGLQLKYLLALLNSKLYYYWMYNKGKLKGKMLELYIRPLSEIPIPNVGAETQKPFIVEVEKILKLSKKTMEHSDEIFEIEKQIDIMVYKLFNLTQEEISTVENSTKNI